MGWVGLWDLMRVFDHFEVAQRCVLGWRQRCPATALSSRRSRLPWFLQATWSGCDLSLVYAPGDSRNSHGPLICLTEDIPGSCAGTCSRPRMTLVPAGIGV